MTAIYRRLGISQTAPMIRLAKPLRLDRQLRRAVRQPQLALILASVANLGLSLRDGGFQFPPGLTLSLKDSACGNQFTQLAEKLGSAFGNCVQRSAAYLNWRYQQHPFRRYDILTLKRGDSLAGYAVTSQEDQALNLVDLFGEPEAISLLVRSIVSIAQRQKLASVTAGIVAGHPWATILRNLGFRQRETCPIVIGKAGPEVSPRQNDCWFLMNGDRES